MAGSITVAIADLRSALSRVLDATEACLAPEVSLAVDHYWHLPVEDAFDLTSEPSRFTVGQVSDDLDEVVRDEPDGIPEAAWHDLSHLIGVLRAWSSPRDREAHSSADPRTHASRQIGTSPG